jgi:hypothetical protein
VLTSSGLSSVTPYRVWPMPRMGTQGARFEEDAAASVRVARSDGDSSQHSIDSETTSRNVDLIILPSHNPETMHHAHLL